MADMKDANPRPEPGSEIAQDVKIQMSRTIRLRNTPVNSLVVEDDFPFVLVGGGQGKVSIVPHPSKDQPTVEATGEPSGLLSGENADVGRLLHSSSSTPTTRRITRVHKVAISPDGSRCLVGGDGKGGTYIEFWAFDRPRYGLLDGYAMDVDERAVMWHEMEIVPSGSKHTISGSNHEVRDATNSTMDMEVLPVPVAAENAQPTANNVGGGLFTY